jgi:hypothetical protein
MERARFRELRPGLPYKSELVVPVVGLVSAFVFHAHVRFVRLLF